MSVLNKLAETPNWKPGSTVPQFEFSFDSVLAMVGDDKAFAAEILQDFLDEANNDMTGIASVLLEPAPTQDQISCVHRHAHRIKGAAGNMGMRGMQDTCELLEFNTREGVWRSDMMDDLRTVAAAIKEQVEEISTKKDAKKL